MMIKCWKC